MLICFTCSHSASSLLIDLAPINQLDCFSKGRAQRTGIGEPVVHLDCSKLEPLSEQSPEHLQVFLHVEGQQNLIKL